MSGEHPIMKDYTLAACEATGCVCCGVGWAPVYGDQEEDGGFRHVVTHGASMLARFSHCTWYKVYTEHLSADAFIKSNLQ